MSAHGNCPGTYEGHCRGCWDTAAALATSQADVTRLVAELAESVRALAVSQGEARLAHRLLRGLLATCSVAPNRSKCDGGCGSSLGAGCLDADLEAVRAFLADLAPPTPTASPEPDRASPEVTVKEPRP